MNSKNIGFSGDRTEQRRRRGLSDEQVKELESAGSGKSGMQTGSAG